MYVVVKPRLDNLLPNGEFKDFPMSGYLPSSFLKSVGQQSSALKQNSSYTCRVYIHLLIF